MIKCICGSSQEECFNSLKLSVCVSVCVCEIFVFVFVLRDVQGKPSTREIHHQRRRESCKNQPVSDGVQRLSGDTQTIAMVTAVLGEECGSLGMDGLRGS